MNDDVPLPEDVTREPSRAEVVDLVMRSTVDERLRLLESELRLLLELRPEVVRGFLAHAFDVAAAEERLQQVSVLANRVEKKLADMLDASAWAEQVLAPSLATVMKQLDRVDKAAKVVGQLAARVGRLEKRVEAASRYVGSLAAGKPGPRAQGRRS